MSAKSCLGSGRPSFPSNAGDCGERRKKSVRTVTSKANARSVEEMAPLGSMSRHYESLSRRRSTKSAAYHLKRRSLAKRWQNVRLNGVPITQSFLSSHIGFQQRDCQPLQSWRTRHELPSLDWIPQESCRDCPTPCPTVLDAHTENHGLYRNSEPNRRTRKRYCATLADR